MVRYVVFFFYFDIVEKLLPHREPVKNTENIREVMRNIEKPNKTTTTEGQCGQTCRFSDLIDSKPNGLHVLALSPLLSAVLLHEGNEEAAVRLARSIWMLQHQLELRVEPKGRCGQEVKG